MVQIIGLKEKRFLVYCIMCEITGKRYVGSCNEYNIKNRINHHISSYKNNLKTCSSAQVLENNKYKVIILKDNIEKDDIKKEEKAFIQQMDCVNIYTPSVFENKKDYRRDYYQRNKKK